MNERIIIDEKSQTPNKLFKMTSTCHLFSFFGHSAGQEMGFDQIDIDPLENGTIVPHDAMNLTAAVTRPGYIYIYLSNQTPGSDVYFDDLMVTHTQSSIIQKNDYYPFGLSIAALTSSRDHSLKNKWTFQGQELQDDFDLGWYGFKYRNHQPEIGRFFNIDPLASDFYYNSTYAFSENRVTDSKELEGLESIKYDFKNNYYYDERTPNAISCLVTPQYNLAENVIGTEVYDPSYTIPTEIRILALAAPVVMGGFVVAPYVFSTMPTLKTIATYSSIDAGYQYASRAILAGPDPDYDYLRAFGDIDWINAGLSGGFKATSLGNIFGAKFLENSLKSYFDYSINFGLERKDIPHFGEELLYRTLFDVSSNAFGAKTYIRELLKTTF